MITPQCAYGRRSSSVSLPILSPARHATVLGILNLLSFWSSETYEGDKISFSVAIDEDDQRAAQVNFFDICKEDYAKVLTSGCDTLLVCNAEGGITAYCEVAMPDEAEAAHVYAPLPFLPVAYWTSQHRCTFCLSRNGDILIFSRTGSLLLPNAGASGCIFASGLPLSFRAFRRKATAATPLRPSTLACSTCHSDAREPVSAFSQRCRYPMDDQRAQKSAHRPKHFAGRTCMPFCKPDCTATLKKL